MLVDYHIHTSLSSDAQGEVLDCVKVACSEKLEEIGISEHYIQERFRNKLCIPMGYKKVSEYFRKMKTFKKKKMSHVKLKFGIEVDFIPGFENEIKEELKRIPFDYVIGSVHFINNWGFDHPKYISEYQKWDILELYEAYFSIVQNCAKSGIFDIIGHLDLIKKFGYKPKGDISELYLATAKALKESQVCVEVNTSGLRHPCHEIYPNKQLLKMCYEEGVQITLGSDAHMPEDVGKDFNKALNMIKEVGYEQIVKFTKRKRQLATI
ncbi:MAG: histidinol-phosphatase HisJ family protein [Candidatus Bathyarchaeia archaeon]